MIYRLRPIFPLLMLFSALLFYGSGCSSWKKIPQLRLLEGPKNSGKSFLLQNLQVEEGMIYDPTSIDKSIRNLIATGSVDDVKVFMILTNHPRKEWLLFLKLG